MYIPTLLIIHTEIPQLMRFQRVQILKPDGPGLPRIFPGFASDLPGLAQLDFLAYFILLRMKKSLGSKFSNYVCVKKIL